MCVCVGGEGRKGEWCKCNSFLHHIVIGMHDADVNK